MVLDGGPSPLLHPIPHMGMASQALALSTSGGIAAVFLAHTSPISSAGAKVLVTHYACST